MSTMRERTRLTALEREFDAQVDKLLRKGYAERAGRGDDEVLQRVEPLRQRLADLPPAREERIAFAIVVTRELLAWHDAMPLLEVNGKQGFTEMEPDDLARFAPLDNIAVPGAPAYLVADVDTGRNTLNVTPDDALDVIARENRSPLTIDEGVALVMHYPDVLTTKNSFSMLGSRCGDRRVTAIWVSRGRPRLGWCWAGNPHTWLGSASCRSRLGP